NARASPDRYRRTRSSSGSFRSGIAAEHLELGDLDAVAVARWDHRSHPHHDVPPGHRFDRTAGERRRDVAPARGGGKRRGATVGGEGDSAGAARIPSGPPTSRVPTNRPIAITIAAVTKMPAGTNTQVASHERASGRAGGVVPAPEIPGPFRPWGSSARANAAA